MANKKLLVRIVQRNVGHLNSNKDFEVDTVEGNLPAVMNEATERTKRLSRNDRSSYYGTEIWHSLLETWVHRTMYYKGYEVSARGSL